MGFLSHRAQGTLAVSDLRGMFSPRALKSLERTSFCFEHRNIANIASKDLTTSALLSGQSVLSYNTHY